MQRFAHLARCAFASGMIFLGVIGLVFRNVGLVWGPVPHWFPQGEALACVLAAVPLAAGVALLFRSTRAAASLVVLIYVALWWLLLKVPEVVKAPLTELTWLDCAMFGILLVGAWTLYAEVGGRPFFGDARDQRLARVCLGLCLIPTGLSHFVYPNFTIPLVPSYLPFRPGWAYFTGACHLAAGLGLLFGVLPRLAAQLEAAMLGLFTLLVWVPRVVTVPSTRGDWTEFWLSWALTAAAAVVAAYVPRSSRAGEDAGAGQATSPA